MDCNTNQTRWKRVSRHHCCPICGKPDWCLTTGPDGSPTAAICARIESDRMVGSEGAGWLHRLRDDHQWHDRPRRRRIEIAAAPDKAMVFGVIADQYATAMSVNHISMIASKLGVKPDSLARLRVGYSVQHRAYTFPMVDAAGRTTGIRLRGTDGQKWSIKGGRQGLFVPWYPAATLPGMRLPFDCSEESLCICEGATDTAALLDHGFTAIGRPSCSGGGNIIIDLVLNQRPSSVIVFADSDVPGQRGARYLASRLVGYVPNGVKIATPPAKDVREWVRSGATADDVRDAIDAAPTMQLTYGVKAVAR